MISVVEPYQPWIAGGLIVGKLGWRLYRQKPLEREIKKLNERIQRNAAILSTIGSRLKKAAKLSMGLVSMAGTGASLGRSMKWIAEDNRASHLLSGLAIGVHAIEGVILVINTLSS